MIGHLNEKILKGPYMYEDLKNFFDINITGFTKSTIQLFFFSIFIDTILLYIGDITRIIDLQNKYKVLLTGGLATKYYYQSHFTNDFDLKIFHFQY